MMVSKWLGRLGVFSALLVTSMPMQAAEAVDVVMQKMLGHAPEQTQQSWQAMQQQYQAQSQQWWQSPNLVLAHENGALGGDGADQVWQAGVEFTLQAQSQRQAKQVLAGAYSELAPAQTRFLRWQASAKLRELAAQQHLAQVALAGQQRSAEQFEKLVSQIQTRVELGGSSLLDLAQVQASQLQQQTQLEMARAGVAQAQSQIQFWLGKDAATPSWSESDLGVLPLSEHPAIAWQMAQISMQEQQIHLAKSMIQGNHTLFIAASHEKADGVDSQKLIAEISVPLSDDLGARLGASHEQLALSKQQMALTQTQAEIQAAISIAQSKLVALQAQQGVLQKALAVQQQSLKLMTSAYELGESSLQPLLMAQQQEMQAQLAVELLQAQIAQAQAQLNQASGHLFAH